MVAVLQRRKLNMFSGEKGIFHRERWFAETPLGPSSWPRIGVTEMEAWSQIFSQIIEKFTDNPRIISVP